MKSKSCVIAVALIATALQPTFAACIGDMMDDYLRDPHGVTTGGGILDGAHPVLVKIAAVFPDLTPEGHWKETGTLELTRIESPYMILPKTFSVRYHKRFSEGVDCETWDFTVLKPGEKLVVFVHPDGKSWVVPEKPATGIVMNVDKLQPDYRHRVQTLFKTRL